MRQSNKDAIEMMVSAVWELPDSTVKSRILGGIQAFREENGLLLARERRLARAISGSPLKISKSELRVGDMKVGEAFVLARTGNRFIVKDDARRARVLCTGEDGVDQELNHQSFVKISIPGL